MNWKSRWSEQHADVDALKQQLQTEGFNAYEWTGRPGGAYLDYIHTQDEVVCSPIWVIYDIFFIFCTQRG